MKPNNIIVVKSKNFAINCIKLYQFLNNKKSEYVISKQLLRSGTSIGANVKEAIRGQSTADFKAKMNIALKEASETEYWIEILNESNYLTKSKTANLLNDCRELIKILTSIVKTTNERINS